VRPDTVVDAVAFGFVVVTVTSPAASAVCGSVMVAPAVLVAASRGTEMPSTVIDEADASFETSRFVRARRSPAR
jgi:hypothetical protein